MEIKQTPCSENRRTRKKISEKSKNLLKSPGKQISIGYKSEKLKLEKSILPIRVTTLMPASNLLSCFNKLMCPYRHLLTLNVLIFLIFMSLINFANCVYINTGGNSQNQEEASLRFKRSYFEINNKVGSRQMSSRDTRSVGPPFRS
uniref:Uncharacterized protein n=1 Tax=Glossina brevipalpis TaxID=37001 RepID=A0A1A9W032_9MUSC